MERVEQRGEQPHEKLHPQPENTLSRAVEQMRALYEERPGWVFLPLSEAGQTLPPIMERVPHFLHWKPTPPESAEAKIYGKQPSHTDLPSNEELGTIFEAYRNEAYHNKG
jgi:hypothetical protein